jgi:hypothetical protein
MQNFQLRHYFLPELERDHRYISTTANRDRCTTGATHSHNSTYSSTYHSAYDCSYITTFHGKGLLRFHIGLIQQ